MNKSRKVFGYCDCFFSRNIFLQRYQLHVHFSSKKQFLKDYEKALISRGCGSERDFEDVLFDIFGEIERRRSYDLRSLERSNIVKQLYIPKHREVYQLKEEFLDMRFIDLVRNFENGNFGTVETIPGLEGVYRIGPIFTPSFCRLLVEELDHFRQSGMPHERPNTMNHNGILLGELGFNAGLLTPLRENYLRALCSHLFPDLGGNSLDTHRGFTVYYTESGGNGDTDLATHYDNAEVTLNLCLSDDFEGGELSFGQMRTEQQMRTKIVEHRKYSAILHRGQHMHGALSLDSGRRDNLILWMRSSEYRDTRGCPRCFHARSECNIIPSTGFGDGFLLGEEDSCSMS